MEEVNLGDDIIEQIKNFNNRELTEEQNVLINKLMPNEGLKERYEMYGLCKERKHINTDDYWCQICESKNFQQNFKNWTSGNHNVDEFIQKAQLKAKSFEQILEWIEQDNFKNVEYLAKGGFGITYKAIWKDGYIKRDYKNDKWIRNGETKVALKCLHDSHDITAEFLKEIESHILAHKSGWVIRCFGISKDSKTNNFMMVMELRKGNLRQHLNDNFNSLNWEKKLYMLQAISYGLKDIHNSGLIHRDLHCGNLLSNENNDKEVYITDLGLCQPANAKISQDDNKEIYGVLPYVAPEVLNGDKYTKASDIYGFGIIAYEICTGLPPYHDVSHDTFLALKICQGLRPNSDYKIPQLIFDIINQCWDAVSSNRPIAKLIHKIFSDLLWNEYNDDYAIIRKQIKEADESNEKLKTSSSLLSTGALSYMNHPQAFYTSRRLDFKNLSKPKNSNLFETEYSDSISIDFVEQNIDSKVDKNN
ncbi:hypothetical protein RclHR1_01630015 [Rhizophagus clarus]|uniref:Kinase-like domain-containing protein n=1 Tax=Rhizophagus clarus TaxID=94130 RepID=A0A2Z6QHE2_9GLOM|nr:hypothetical protein RclHR1_01630015 [Rhizophagus clarus]GES91830.1 kinase-like domain-containing protein [Rhizophagus clarus]